MIAGARSSVATCGLFLVVNKNRRPFPRIDLIFRSRLVSAVAGRIFLYGEPLSAKTFLKALLR